MGFDFVLKFFNLNTEVRFHVKEALYLILTDNWNSSTLI